jgi:tetratricopeptide (TPR) repeat protein
VTIDIDPLGQAASLLQGGQALSARGVLDGAMAEGLDSADAHHLMGLILQDLDDAEGCERALRAALARASDDASAAHTLARLLASQGRDEAAAETYAALAHALPEDSNAEYALAISLYVVGREAESEAALNRAIAKGAEGPDVWVTLGRVMTLQARFAESEEAYREAVTRDPLSVDAHRELAQIVWMRTADVAKAREALDAAPPTAALTAVTVKLLQDADEHAAAFALACERADRDPSLNVLAGRAGLRVDPAAAAGRLKMAPPWIDPPTRAKGEIEADLALGRGAEAARRCEALRAARPEDRYVEGLMATAWRMTGDERYGPLYDYHRLVRTYRIEPPEGWSTLEAYLADLEAALDRLHGPLTHPVGQSLRHGSQTQRSLIDYPDPEIQGFFQVIDAPIRAHIEAIGETGGYAVNGAWSVRLNRQGYHLDHVHPEGWLSSAFYIRLPKGEGREGWIKFGEPGIPTSPKLDAEYWIEPEPGMLVLFPSGMWHGTAPFSSDGTRLTCAFDLVRA